MGTRNLGKYKRTTNFRTKTYSNPRFSQQRRRVKGARRRGF